MDYHQSHLVDWGVLRGWLSRKTWGRKSQEPSVAVSIKGQNRFRMFYFSLKKYKFPMYVVVLLYRMYRM